MDIERDDTIAVKVVPATARGNEPRIGFAAESDEFQLRIDGAHSQRRGHPPNPSGELEWECVWRILV